MKEIYPRYGRSAYSLGFLVLVVAAVMGYFQWSEYLQTGRVIVSYRSDRGASYGPTFYLVFPLLEAGFGALCLGAGRIRLEVSSEAIAQFGLFGRLLARIEWAEVTAFRRTGQHAGRSGNDISRVVNDYAVVGAFQTVTFDESLPKLSHLIRGIRENLPATAVNELPAPTA